MADYEVVSCNRFGDARFTHNDAVFTSSISEALNEPGGFSFSVPLTDPNFGELKPVSREVQVYRNGLLLWWGVITRTRFDQGLREMEVEVEGLFWYFTRLYFGKAERGNFLTNGSFDTGSLSPWVAQGVTANIVTAWGMRPDQTFQLNLNQQGSGQDTFVTQTVAVSGGVYFTISADFHIRTDNIWVGPAIDNRGLYVERVHPNGTTVEEVQFFAIDDNTPRGVFQHASVGISTPPGRNSYLRVRLYATRCRNATGSPQGSIIWDNVKMTVMESLSFPLADVGSIANQIVGHAQDPAYGKTDLNIGQGSPTDIGVLAQRFYQFAEHPNIGDALKDMADAGLCDFGFTWDSNDPHHRAFRVYGSAGTIRSDLTLEYDSDFGLTDIKQIERDGNRTYNAIIVTSDQGSGPEKDEAAAIDTSFTDNVTLEEIIQSSEHHDLLGQVAENELRHKKATVDVTEAVVAPALIGRINMGDRIPLIVDTGFVSIGPELYRVVASEIDPATDEYTVSLNPAPFGI